MNPFERHIQEHLSGPASPKPEWIRRAQRNARRRELRFAKRFSVSPQEARERLTLELEENAQEIQ